MKAEIIAVGTELLLGDIVNTNARFLARELANLGVDVYHQAVVGDNEKRLLEEFERAFENCELVITSGGLGPTEDDLTKETAAKYLNKNLEVDNKSLEDLENYFKKINKPITDNNKKQCYFPKDSIILENPNGTAPGCIMIEKVKKENGTEGEKIIAVLPGPPRELEPMFLNHVVPFLQERSSSMLKSKVLRIFGVGESTVETKVKDLIKGQSNPTIAPYVKNVEAILRITAKGNDEESCDKLIEPVEKEIRKRLGDAVYAEGETTLEDVLGKILIEKKLTIATAESCTGGLLAGALINYPGISEVFLEGAVTYSNEAKMKRLGVKAETLEKFGAVSEETAKEMAEGIAKVAEAKIGVSTTGIAGPGGGTEEKPVGLVYIAVSFKGETTVKKFNFAGDRERVRLQSVLNGLFMILTAVNN
ncbi:MAG: competence/damage-inducible protein A [Sarcina sp.]